MEGELGRLAAVYGVYAQYADALRQYSNQLWSELDVGRMTEGMQEVGTSTRAGCCDTCPAHVAMAGGALATLACRRRPQRQRANPKQPCNGMLLRPCAASYSDRRQARAHAWRA